MLLALETVSAEPTISISKVKEGDWFVTPDLLMKGTAQEHQFDWVLGEEDFKNGTFRNLTLVDGKLVFNPINHFDAGFDDVFFDFETWWLNRQGYISQRDSILYLRGHDNDSFPLVVSKGDAFPEDTDWTARVIIKYNDYGNYSDWFGWGMTANETDPYRSLVSIFTDNSRYSIIVNGTRVANWIYLGENFGTLEVVYSRANDTYMVHHGGRMISSIHGGDRPVRFWIGCP
jgi:hypothetical protein